MSLKDFEVFKSGLNQTYNGIEMLKIEADTNKLKIKSDL